MFGDSSSEEEDMEDLEEELGDDLDDFVERDEQAETMSNILFIALIFFSLLNNHNNKILVISKAPVIQSIPKQRPFQPTATPLDQKRRFLGFEII